MNVQVENVIVKEVFHWAYSHNAEDDKTHPIPDLTDILQKGNYFR